MERSGLHVEIRQVDDPSRVITFVGVSDQTRVRDRFFLVPRGVVAENYRRNPVFLWAHDYAEPAIGRTLDLQVEDERLLFVVEFAGREVNPFAEVVYQLYRRGFMRAVSAGWITLEREVEDLADGGSRIRITRWDLLELSAVPVPADPGAVMVSACPELSPDLVRRAVAVWQGAEDLRPGAASSAEGRGQRAEGEADRSLFDSRLSALEMSVAEIEGMLLEQRNHGGGREARPALPSPEELAASVGRILAREVRRQILGRLD
jgi:HK97 family phage prohead protease